MTATGVRTGIEQVTAGLKVLSTGYNVDLSLANILGIDKDWVNPCSPKFIKLLSLPRTIRYTYNNESITSVSVKLYGVTSLWYLIVACSDYLHPHEIPKNTVIFLPSLTDVHTAIKDVVESNVGKTIVI